MTGKGIPKGGRERKVSMRQRTRGLSPRGMLRPLTWVVGLTLLTLVPKGWAQTPAQFEVSKYTIDAELFPSTHQLNAKAKIDFIPSSAVSSLNFELDSALKVSMVSDASGQDLNFKQDGLAFGVNFPSPLNGGAPSSITVEYSGDLETSEGSPVEDLKLAYVGPEGSYLLYAGRWFPVSGYEVNRFAAILRITVPSGETVIASGTASEPQMQPGKTTYTFQYDQKSFPGTVLAGDYAVQPATAVGADITLYLKKGHENYAASYGDTAAKILAFYSLKFGPLPNSHLDLVEIDDGSVGGYSAPGVTAIASRGFSNPVNYQLLAHELAHQWWGCLVSPATPDDAYLDNGLAEYSAAMYIQDAAGQNAFEQDMHEIEIGALTHEEAAPIHQASRLREFTPEYESVVYKKGAMVFHMLRWVIGDDAFFKTLQDMTQQYAEKSITSEEFQKLAEKAGNQQLTYFFALWVDSTGVPQFKRTWDVYRTANGYQVVGKVQQDLDIFRMPVEVRVFTDAPKPVDERVELVGTTTDFTIDSKLLPRKVEVDPGSHLLKYDDNTKLEVEMARGDELVQEQAYLEAMKQYTKVLDLNPNSSLAHYRLGELNFKLHNYNVATEEMRETLNGDLKPKWVEVWAHLMLGKIFDVTGQRDRALGEYQRALQTNDNSQGALDQANRYIQKPYTESSSQTGQGA